MIEAKVSHGAAVGAVTGLVVWGLVAYVPAFHDGVPVPVVAVLPFTLAWAGHVLAAWLAPHTPRPDLPVAATSPVNGPPSIEGHP